MTGFGKSDVQHADFSLDIAVKAVNGRYLEIKVNGPKIYHVLEADIRKKVSQVFKRGTVDVFINRKKRWQPNSIHFDQVLAQDWLQGFNKLSQKLGLGVLDDPRVLFQIPELVKTKEESDIGRSEKKIVMDCLGQALKRCDQLKVKEGSSLQKDIRTHLTDLQKLTQKIRKSRQQVLQSWPDAFKKRIEKLGADLKLDSQRMHQEAALLLERSDISEELHRLDVHLSAILKLCNEPDSIGKKLDFYAQELLREMNTVASKSSDSELTGLAVNGKALIEKYREQVQNVE